MIPKPEFWRAATICGLYVALENGAEFAVGVGLLVGVALYLVGRAEQQGDSKR